MSDKTIAVAEKKGSLRATNVPTSGGLTIRRYFTKPGVHPFDEITWELRTAVISNEKGEKIFEQKNVEIPKTWSMTATNVVVSKYFHGLIGTPERETSIRQLVDRVAKTTTKWGREGSYFATEEDAEIFYHELSYLLVNQYMAFNSPVWFNVGVEERPQCSAWIRFLNSRERKGDSLSSVRGQVPTFRRFGLLESISPAAEPRPARFLS